MGILWNPISDKSSGGTELLCRRLEAALDPALLDLVQIVPSRLYGLLDESKIRILWLHDLPGDPESQKILSNGGWNKFHRLVFVSNWQMQQYIGAYNIPWSMCTVIQNSIDPIEDKALNVHTLGFMDKTTRFIYHTTPHRGLDILVAVFEKLAETHPNIFLDVYSSFGAYGWQERDVPFEPLFDRIRQHPKMTYHGFQPNEVIRDALTTADVFAYPNTWPETSCLALIEAMSAGLMCIHPNHAALYETAANWTMMYQFQEKPEQHAGVFLSVIENFLQTIEGPAGWEPFKQHLQNQVAYADAFYNWSIRQRQWGDMIASMANVDRALPKEMFTYRTS